MTKIAEVQDRAACAVWSPVASHPHLVAMGSKDSGGLSFENTGGLLEIYDMLTEKEPQLLCTISTSVRFANLSWTPYTGANNDFAWGILAGGMVDGTLHLWDPQVLCSSNSSSSDNGSDAAALIKSFPKHTQGAVSAMQFSELEPYQLATGGSNGRVYIIDLSHPDAIVSEPCPGQHQTSEITAVAWNSQVAHIVASSASDGSVSVWDLKARKPWCELRAGHAIADVLWNPSQGLHLLTASADDRNSVVQVWDLGASTSMPLATLQGHGTGGLLYMAWCPHDETLLLTCAKDNRTILWDLLTLQPIADLPLSDYNNGVAQNAHSQATPTAVGLFGGAGAAGGVDAHKSLRYLVAWSPLKRGLALTCSLDRKVQIHSILSLATRSGRPPKWMKPASSVSTAFGGVVLACQGNSVCISVVPEQESLVQISQEAEVRLESVMDFCIAQAQQKKSPYESELWGFLHVVFATHSRQELLRHLGLDADAITASAERFVTSNSSSSSNNIDNSSEHTTSSKLGLPKPPPMPGAGDKNNTSVPSTSTFSGKARNLVQKSLLVGDFDAAVNVCISSGNWADALILSSCGSSELWQQTQQRYFDSQTAGKPFLQICQAVLHQQLPELIAKSNPRNWQETLAILSTYAVSEEFPTLCETLGQHLDDAGDRANASLCYLCALHLEKTVQHWTSLLEAQSSEGEINILALHDFVVKVTVFLQAVGNNATLPEDVSALFVKYATVLSEQGLLSTAAKYLKDTSNTDEAARLLKDRLYRSRYSQFCLQAMNNIPPEFPFTMVAVDTSRGQNLASAQRDAVVQARQAQQQRVADAMQRQDQQKQYQQQQEQQQQPQQQSSAYNQQQQYQTNVYGQQQHQQQTNNMGQAQSQESAYGQSQSQQQQAYSNFNQARAATPTVLSPESSLPSEWMELQDPSSGMPYYYNQQTGETTWDRPHVAPATGHSSAPTTASQHVTMDNSRHSTISQSSHGMNGNTPKKSHLVSKYGDGFVSSASHPELAYQYGNVGTSNPYSGVERPGTAAAVLGSRADAPVSGTFNVGTLELSAEHQPIKDALVSCITTLQSAQLTPVDKKQLIESEKGVAILIKKLARGDLDDDMIASVNYMVGAVCNRDYTSALSTQTQLVNSDWRTQKDWLKGVKLLIQLLQKKF